MINSALRRFADPEAFQKFVRGGDARVLVSARGDYQGELTRVDLPHIWMQRFWQSLPTLTHIKVDNARTTIVFLTDPQQHSATYSGLEIGPGAVVSSALGDEHHIRFPAGCTLSACSLTAEDLAFFGRALTRREVHAPTVNRVVHPDANQISRLRKVHSAAVTLAASTPDILAVPEVGKAVEQALIQAAVACLVAADDVVTTWSSAASSRALRRFEELLENRKDEPLYIPEICAAIGIGGRTFRAYCHEHLGMSPHRYLWLRRMNLVKRALLQADPRKTTVTDIATQYGFGELGRFAVSYRNLFGESPSATLRLKRDTVPSRSSNFGRPDSVFA